MSGWDEYDPNDHELSNDPEYRQARARAAVGHLQERWRRRIEGARSVPSTLYHYTSTFHLPLILEAHQLRLTESNIEMTGAGPRVVWLTDLHTTEAQPWQAGGFKSQVIITLSAPMAQWWPEWSRKHGIDEDWYEALARSGGDPETWWVTERPIHGSLFKSIEVNGKPLWSAGMPWPEMR